MRIADTSAQDVTVQAKPKTRNRVLVAAGLIGLILIGILYIPTIQRWASSSISVPKDRLRLAVVERADLVQDLLRQVDELNMRSPVSGIVGNLMVDRKAAVSRNQVVMAVVDLTAFEIEAQVPESYADDLGLGMDAEVLVGNQKYPATLVSVSPEIIQNQVTTRIRFEGAMPPGLRQNQRLTTRILMEEKNDVLTLQRGQFLDSGGGRVAYVLDEDNVAHRRSIEIGARSLAAVEIVNGLDKGDVVVISSIDQFRSADTVLVTN